MSRSRPQAPRSTGITPPGDISDRHCEERSDEATQEDRARDYLASGPLAFLDWLRLGPAMFIGIDLGTSAVKIVLVDEAQRLVASVGEVLHPRQPHPLWSEDDPEAWWAAVVAGMDRLSRSHHDALARVQAIGLSGQMHGALLLDAADQPVRPAILWNDGRAMAEAAELAALGPAMQAEMGVVPMRGFTGPNIKWLRRHEPETLARARHLLLPKDYLRFQLAGERITDPSDAAGTWLLDEAARAWSGRAVAACDVDPAWLPALVESVDLAGRLRPELATRWGMPASVAIAGGGGDTPVGGVGIGTIADGQGFISLGTSAQVFVAATSHKPAADRFVHAFCHALPGRWCRMAALLNGASPLAAVGRWTGHTDIGALLTEVEAAYRGPSPLLALPYLFGERTPHNDPHARAAILGMTGSTQPLDLVQAMLESVAFSLADGFEALGAREEPIEWFGFLGGGARSLFWGRLIASVLGIRLVRYDAADRGPAYGAARLARLCATGEDPATVAVPPPVESVIEPDPALHDLYQPRLLAFRAVYAALRPTFPLTLPQADLSTT